MSRKSNQQVTFSFKKTALLLSSLFMINLVYGATITWVGGTGSGSDRNDWSLSGNWSTNSVPTSNDDVILPNVSRDPIISSSQSFTVKSLTINTNGALTLSGSLSVLEDVSVSGTLTNNGSLIVNGAYTGKLTQNSTTCSLKIYGTLDVSSTLSSKGTIEFAGTNQVIPDKNLFKVTISGTGATLSEDVTYSNVFTLNVGSSLEIASGKTLTLTGSSAVINGTISGAGTLALNKSGSGTNNNLFVSGAGVVTALVTMADEVTLVDGSTVDLGQFTVSANQTFTNNNILFYTSSNVPTINGKLSGTGMMIVGTGVSYATVGDKGRFELTGSVSEIRTSTTAYTNLYEYGTETKTTTPGVNSGTKYRTFTIGATAPARLANGNARVAAGGRVFSLGSAPVPVALVAFDGVLEGNSVLISWATSMEFNNKEFLVEASNDAINFEQVASVQGVGTANSLSNYSVKVVNPSKYYRLKQIDFDGVSTYSKIIEVSSNNVNEFTVFPNPLIGNDLYINYNGSSEADGIIVKIYDLNEKVHFETTLNFFGNEVSKLALTEKLNNGVYFVSIQSQTGVKIQKLLVE